MALACASACDGRRSRELGKSISAYAKAVGRPHRTVQRGLPAAEVYREVTAFAVTAPTDQPRHLAEIHVAEVYREVGTYVPTAPTDRPRHLAEVHAAEVYREVSPYGLTAPTDQPRHLAEVHAAPQWLWSRSNPCSGKSTLLRCTGKLPHMWQLWYREVAAFAEPPRRRAWNSRQHHLRVGSGIARPRRMTQVTQVTHFV
jgi:hypothetical protein